MSDAATLAELLANLAPTPGSYLSAARRVQADFSSSLRRANLAVLSTYTAEVLRPYLVVERARRGFGGDVYFGPFNQLEQEVIDANSGLYASRPDALVVLAQLDELAPGSTDAALSLSEDRVAAQLERLRSRLRGLLEAARSKLAAPILVSNFAEPPVRAAGLADASLPVPQGELLGRANRVVAEVCRDLGGAYVFDYARLVAEHGATRWYDARLQALGRIPLGALAQVALAGRLARYTRALFTASCKCVVLDLDNTLWGGVLGEEGMRGIALGDDYPGNAFKEFQRYLLRLRDQGVLLAVASKNNRADAMEALASHPEMILRPEHFAALEIHWEDKASSLRAIARELNVDVSALAFVDDNPVERDWVRSQVPEVAVVDLPADPTGYVRALEQAEALDRLVVSAEDARRAEMYREARGRDAERGQHESVDDFLRGLETRVTVGLVDALTLPRVAQLLGKTNQFNLTTRRHTEAKVMAMVEAGAVALWARVADKYGDSGLVGVAIAEPDGGRWTVDSLLLSCRVLGRRVETAVLAALADAVRRRGGRELVGEYAPTAKNGQVAGFYAAHGFVAVEGEENRWRLDLERGGVSTPEVLTVEFTDEVTDERKASGNNG